ADAEELGGAGAVVVGGLEGLLDEDLLGLGHVERLEGDGGAVVRGGAEGGGEAGGGEGEGGAVLGDVAEAGGEPEALRVEGVGPEERLLAEDDRALDGVLELADVAG